MPIDKLDAERCRLRNRTTALRGRHAASVKFLSAPPKAGTSARGTLPEDDAGALERINAVLGREGESGLKPEDVYLIYPEVGNTNYVSDRSMFLGRSTLRNVASMANAGFAFMNSHRTGDMSTPTELPFGRTFAGRYETTRADDGTISARTVVGAYMLRGQSPNGANGPTTDDLYAGISGGTIFDVSLGLYGGEAICDVCGSGLNERDREGNYLCPHVPGTLREMTDEDIASQSARGIPDGVATYTLEDANPGEFSAVFDGAVPGAGFRKAVSLARAGGLSRADLSRAGVAYRSLLSPAGRSGGTSDVRNGGKPMPSLLDIFRKVRVSESVADELGLGELDPIDDDTPAPRAKFSAGATPPQPDASDEVKKLREDLATERKAREDEKRAREEKDREALAAKIHADAAAFAEKFSAKLTPACRTSAARLYADAALHAALPAAGFTAEHFTRDGKPLDAVADLDAFCAALPDHGLGAGSVVASQAKGLVPLANGADGPDEETDRAWAKSVNDRNTGRRRGGDDD